jgi:cyanophycin synthetase
MKENYTISTQIIINQAKERGIKVLDLCPGKVVKLTYGDHEEHLCCQFISKTTSVAYEIANNKNLTKQILKEVGISIAEGEKFTKTQFDEALTFAKRIGFPVVIKPTNSSHGNCVFANIADEKDFIKHWQKVSIKFNNILVERYFTGGTEYRVVASRDKVLGITNRVPANVVGDGIRTIKELVDIKNSDPRRGDDSYKDFKKCLVKIDIDDIIVETLKKSDRDIHYKPKAGEQIFLRENSNLSTGGDSIDFTDKVHPSVHKIAIEVVRAIPGLAYGGMDFLSKDITVQQTPDNHIIVEINSSPGIFMHHFPYEGKPRNVAGDILDIAFPETKKEA